MYFRMIVGGKTLDELQKGLREAASRLGGGEITISSDRIDTFAKDPKEIADQKLKEEASINEMYTDVDNSAESVETEDIYERGLTNAVPVAGLDSRGFPWDSRIHSASKALNKDKTWRYRRGVEESTIAKVEAELRGAASQPINSDRTPGVPAVEPKNVLLQDTGLPPVAREELPQVFQQAAPVTPPPVAAPVSTPVPSTPQMMSDVAPAHTLETFSKQFPQVMAQLSMSGKITPDYINKLKQFFGVNEIWEVMKNSEQLAQMYNQFCQINLITRV